MKRSRIFASLLALAMLVSVAALAAGNKTITVTPMNMTVNGKAVTPTKSDGTAAETFAYDGTTYVPLRYLSERLGLQVEWDANDSTTAKLINVPEENTYTSFLDWMRAEDRYKSVGATSKTESAVTGYVKDASGKPTKEEMDDILDFTSKAVASGGENDVYFVVVEDKETQDQIVGTNKGAYTGDGTVTVLVYSERLVDPANQVSADGTKYKYQVDRGYYDAGIATGYFNIACTAYGYSTHMFQGVVLANSAVGERSDNYDQFLKDADGNWLVYRNGDTTSAQWYGDHPTENLKFICAIVVGTMDRALDIDGFTGATVRSEYPANYAYWSGYTAKPVLESLLPNMADGTYIGTGKNLHGNLSVKVTVEKNKIVKLEIVDGQDVMISSEDDRNAYLQRIIDQQNVQVDGISGATVEAKAIADAVVDAID